MIVIGDGFLHSLETLYHGKVTDSGSYDCVSPVTGRYIFLEVTFKLLEDSFKLNLLEIRPIGMPNLTKNVTILVVSTSSSYPDK